MKASRYDLVLDKDGLLNVAWDSRCSSLEKRNNVPEFECLGTVENQLPLVDEWKVPLEMLEIELFC